MSKLSDFLKANKDKIVKTVRTNVVRETVGYSEYTQWDTTVSFDEMEVVDFDALMEQIAEFENSFRPDNQQATNEPSSPNGSRFKKE